MPVVFAQPSPMGSAADAGVGAGIADIDTKDFGTLAGLFEHYASLRQQLSLSGQKSPVYMPGGGGGFTGDSGGGGGQGAVNLGFEAAQPDLVARHLQMKQQALAGQQGQTILPSQVEPAQWTPEDENELAETNNSIAQIAKGIGNGTILPEEEDIAPLIESLPQKAASLNQRKRQAQQYQQQQQWTMQAQNQAHSDGLSGLKYSQAGQIQGFGGFAGPVRGSVVIPNPGGGGLMLTPRFDGKTGQQTGYDRVEFGKDAGKAAQHVEDQKAKQDQMNRDEQRKNEDAYIKHFTEQGKVVDKIEEDWMQRKDLQKDTEEYRTANRARWSPQERADEIGRRMEAMGLPKSMGDFRAQRGEPTAAAALTPTPSAQQAAQTRAAQVIESSRPAREKILNYDIPFETKAKINSAWSKLDQLNWEHGGDLSNAPDEVKAEAQRLGRIIKENSRIPKEVLKPTPAMTGY